MSIKILATQGTYSNNRDMSAHSTNLVLWFSEVDKEDVYLVGEKGANLGEITSAGFSVPNGFIVSSHAYFNFLRENRLSEKIKHLLSTINYDRPESTAQVSEHIKKLILEAQQSKELIEDITQSYSKLSGLFKQKQVAVRSSATTKDLPLASLAGQQNTYLNIKGYSNVLLKIKECWASLFDARTIFYRHEKNFDHFRIGMAVIVQHMIESDKSGHMFTVDPITNDKNKIVIEAIYGLGGMITQGQITPDHYEIDKKNYYILQKKVQIQDKMLKKVSFENRIIKLTTPIGNQQKITDEEIIQLAEIGKKLEHHYYFPQECEWAIEDGKIYIVQTRPITTFSKAKSEKANEPSVRHGGLLLKGAPASPGIASGPVKILQNSHDVSSVTPGEVLVVNHTNQDYSRAMKKANAIVSQIGGHTSLASIVSKEIGIPAITGIENAIKTLKNGQVVTVNGTLGEVYSGGFINGDQKKELLTPKHLQTATKVYVNLSETVNSDKVAQKDVDGVGLLKAESMITSIGIHPKKILQDGTQKEYIAKLAGQLENVCRNFGQRPVIYKASDFKSNEYRNLIGGKTYELTEENPLIGYRGAFRYIHDPQVFYMELEAIKIVRNKMGLKNLWLMVPFVRNVRELIEVKKIIASAGLYRSPSFKLYMMCEIPSNVILLEKFIEVGLDGVSIGSDNLTTLMLGTDRDNSEVAHEFDERNEAMLWAFEHVLKICKKHSVSSSICGQAPSLYPDMLEKLVRWGISSISISPDLVESAREQIARIESNL